MSNETIAKELIKVAKVLISAELSPEEGEVFTAEVSRQLKKKKKELGIKSMKQNYKGVGNQKAGRQVWIRFINGAVIDVWLYPSHITYGGVVNIDPTGSRTKPHPNIVKLNNENPKKVAEMIVDDLKTWMEEAIAESE